MELSSKGLALIKEFEGYRSTAYLCPAGVWTIGYGTTAGVTRGQKVTKAQAESLLRHDLIKFQKAVGNAVKVPLTQGQYDALVCLVYNIGEGSFRKSTLLKVLNQKRYDAAARQFDVWVMATVNGKKKRLPGLVRRRAAEQALFKSGNDLDDDEPIAPSTVIEPVEPKSAMNSKTVAGAGVAVAAGGGAVVDQISDMAEKHSSIIDTLLSTKGFPIWCGIIAAVAIGYMLYRWHQDRKERI